MIKPSVLLIGVDEDIKQLLENIFSKITITEISLDLQSIQNVSREISPCFILTNSPNTIDSFSCLELSKLLREKFDQLPCFIYFKTKEGFQTNLLENNGFNEVFLLPSDHLQLQACLSSILSTFSQGTISLYRSVKLIDILPGDTLNFDTSLYLPKNKKYIKLSNSGESLDLERIERVKNHDFSTIQVTLNQLGEFYAYTADRLKKISNSDISATEKSDRLKLAIRDLMRNLFNDQDATEESGKEIMKDCSAIVKSYILQESNSDWYHKIEQVLGQNGDHYSHAGNVSTLAVLFGIGVGVGNSEDLAIAGLLHDIGITELPFNIQNTLPEKMNSDELTEYKKHPELSVNLIKSRKILVSDQVTKLILEHHELFCGDGYPHQLAGNNISKESQIVTIADRFDELTNARDPSIKSLSPSKALKKLMEEQYEVPSKIKYNPELLKEIVALFS